MKRFNLGLIHGLKRAISWVEILTDFLDLERDFLARKDDVFTLRLGTRTLPEYVFLLLLDFLFFLLLLLFLLYL